GSTGGGTWPETCACFGESRHRETRSERRSNRKRRRGHDAGLTLMYKESRASAAETAMTLWPNQVLEIPKMVSQTIQNSGRICTACGLWKPANEFYRNSRKRGGIKSKCAQCTRIQNANRRAARLEQYRA